MLSNTARWELYDLQQFNCKRISIRGTTSAASIVWHMELRLFRSVVPPFCVSSSIKTVHALALEI